MIKAISLGFATLVVAFFMGAVVVNAQTSTTTPTRTPTATPTMTQSTTTTPAPPQTGFGN